MLGASNIEDAFRAFMALYQLPLLLLSAVVTYIAVGPRRKPGIETYYSPHPTPLRRRKTDHDEDLEEETLISLLKRKLSTVFGPDAGFVSVPWLPSGDFHTIYASIGDFSKVDLVEYERIHISYSDGGLGALDIYPTFKAHPQEPGEPIVFVTHGLTGGSHENYVRSTISVLCAPKSQGGLGMRAVVMNSRGCNGSPLTFPKIYHAGTTNDLRHAILWVSKTFPDSPIFAIGYSLGANQITRYTGQEGTSCPLSGVVSVANPFDFLRANNHIESGSLMNKYLYNYALGGALQALITRHLPIYLSDPRSAVPVGPLKEFVEKKRVTIRDFDEVATRHSFGYANADDYYAQVSSVRVLENIAVPFLGLNARDDPVTGTETLPKTQALCNPWILLVRTEHGGHIGWFEAKPGGGVRRWYPQPIKEFFGALLEYGVAPPARLEFDEVDGRTVMKGRPDISVRVLRDDEVPPSVPIKSSAKTSAVPFHMWIMRKLFTGW
ncbi:AB-hydrolase YheT [Peniophora sp. CONT]|nr:AB-hydrolase YheT [Peniophora sp. CONT]